MSLNKDIFRLYIEPSDCRMAETLLYSLNDNLDLISIRKLADDIEEIVNKIGLNFERIELNIKFKDGGKCH